MELPALKVGKPRPTPVVRGGITLILFFAYAGQWAAEIKRKDIKNRKENKEKGNSNEELP